MQDFSTYKYRYLSWIMPALILSLVCVMGVLPMIIKTHNLKKELRQKESLSYTKVWLDSINNRQNSLLDSSGNFLQAFENKLSKENSADPIAKTIRQLFTTSDMDVSKITTEEIALGKINKVSVRVSGTSGFNELNKMFQALYTESGYYEIAQMTIRKKKKKLSYGITVNTYKKGTGKLYNIKITR